MRDQAVPNRGSAKWKSREVQRHSLQMEKDQATELNTMMYILVLVLVAVGYYFAQTLGRALGYI